MVVITEAGQAALDLMPPQYTEDPTIQAIVVCGADELAKVNEAIETVKSAMFPATAEITLALWEVFLGLPVAPEGQSYTQRRTTVIAYLKRALNSGSGIEWEENVSAFLGSDWSYLEHDPNDPDSPAPFTLQIFIPYGPDSLKAWLAEQLISTITPANMQINVSYTGGFRLGVSSLGDPL